MMRGVCAVISRGKKLAHTHAQHTMATLLSSPAQLRAHKTCCSSRGHTEKSSTAMKGANSSSPMKTPLDRVAGRPAAIDQSVNRA